MLPMVTDNGAQKTHVMKNWSRRGLWVDLLGHVMSPAEIALLTVPQKLARCYCYAEADHFQDTAEQEVSVAAFRAALRELKPGHKQWISFLKQQLSNGTLCSCPEAICSKLAGEDAAMHEDKDLDAEEDLNDQVLQEAFGGDETVLPDLASGNVVYCQVVDARPENRAAVSQGAAAGPRSRSTMLVQQFADVRLLKNEAGHVDAVEVCGVGSTVTLLGLRRSCTPTQSLRCVSCSSSTQQSSTICFAPQRCQPHSLDELGCFLKKGCLCCRG